MPTMFVVTTPPLLARMAIQGLVPPFSFNASGTRYNVTLRAITDAERATMDNDDGSRTDRKALTTCSIVAPPTPASRMDQSAEMKSEITLDFAKQQFAITGEIGQATDGAQKFPTYYVNFTKAGDVLNAAGLHLLHEKGIVGPSSNVKYDIKWNKDLLSDLGLCAVCAASDICDHGRVTHPPTPSHARAPQPTPTRGPPPDPHPSPRTTARPPPLAHNPTPPQPREAPTPTPTPTPHPPRHAPRPIRPSDPQHPPVLITVEHEPSAGEPLMPQVPQHRVPSRPIFAPD